MMGRLSNLGFLSMMIRGIAACPDGAEVCIDFESNLPGGWNMGSGGVEVSTADAHSGGSSLKFSGGTYDGNRFMKGPAIANGHYGRMFIKVTSAPARRDYTHSTFVILKGGGREVRTVDTVMNKGKYQWLLNIDLGGNEVGLHTGYDFSFEPSWKCVEWYIDGASKAYKFWYEGQQKIDSTLKEIPDTFDQYGFGVNAYAGNGAKTEGFIDDIVLARDKVGCDIAGGGSGGTPGGGGSGGTPGGGAVCAADEDDCSSAKCCSDASKTCYKKDDSWASCRSDCTPGISADDPPEYQTAWSCDILSSKSGHDGGSAPTSSDGQLVSLANGKVAPVFAMLVAAFGALTK